MINNNSKFMVHKIPENQMDSCNEKMLQDTENWFDNEIEAWTVGFDKIKF
jgi:hypothetical protein